MQVEEIRKKLARKASIMVLGGFRPPVDPLTSWFGRVRVAQPHEIWPTHEEKPMLPLCQINCAELPYKPEALSDIAFVSVFVSQDYLPNSTANGDGWELRTYASVDGLIEVEQPELTWPIEPQPVRWELTEEDYPCRDDLEFELPSELEEDYDDLFENQYASKVGGWPSLIQSEIFWAPWNKHPANPAYVFQINSEEKANWNWSDAGVGYFGRGTGAATDQWTLEWQCY